MTIQKVFENYIKDYLLIDKKCTGECDGKNKDCEKCTVINRHKTLRSELKDYLSISDKVDSSGEQIGSFLTGSYKRNTIIRPPKDVDFFIVLTGDEYTDFSPSELLGILYASVVAIYPDKEDEGKIKVQTHSVTVEYTDNFGIDIIPAFEEGDSYKIPSIDDGNEKWLLSNPKVHEEIVHDINSELDGQFLNIARLIKAWKRDIVAKYGIKLKSFHLEMLAVEILKNSKVDNIADGLVMFFSNADSYLHKPSIKDKANESSYLDDYLSSEDREKLLEIFNETATTAKEAKQLEDDNKDQDSIDKWKIVFSSSDFGKSINKTAAEIVSSAIVNKGLYTTSDNDKLTTNQTNEGKRIPQSSSWANDATNAVAQTKSSKI